MNDNENGKPTIINLPVEPPPLDKTMRDEPRGGAVDHDAAVAKGAADVPALPGASDASERAKLRATKIAAIRANRGRTLNSFADGGLEGLGALAALALIGVTLGPELAIAAGVVGVVVSVAKGL